LRCFAFVIAAFLCATSSFAEVIIYRGGPIITMAGDEPETVEAIAVDDGKIIAVGTEATVSEKAGKKAKQVDLSGRTMLPGFIDAHGHISAVGATAGLANLSTSPVGQVNTIADLQETLRNCERPEGIPVIIGWGYDDSLIAEHRHPTRQELDAVSTVTPIMISHASGDCPGSWIAGGISDLFGADATGIRQRLTIVVPVGIIGAPLIWLGATTLQPDKKALADRETA